MPIPLLIAAKDLRQRLRDRSAIVIGLLAPLVIAGVMSMAFRGTETFHFTLGVVNADNGSVSTGLLQSLRSPELRHVVSIRNVPDAATASAELRAREVQAVLVIPTGFSASVTAGSPKALTTLTSVNNIAAGNIAASLASSFVAQLNADRLSVATALGAGASPADLRRLQAAAASLRIPEAVLQRPLGARPLKAVSYFSPAMAIFFLFFTISFTARSFYADRAQGMIERMRVAPIRPLSILLGKALSSFVFGVASLGIVALVTSAAFGASWGPPAAVALVCVALVLAVVCLTALVIGLARTQRQADGISSAITFGLALLGGNFVFVSAAPDLLRRLALFTPNGWALRAFTDMSTTGGGLHTVLVPVCAIVGFSLVVGAVAASLARRAVTT